MTMEKNYRAYEYMEASVPSGKASFWLDCYENFGWQQDENFPSQAGKGKVLLKLKRDRKQINRTELTRLQKHFEADMEEIAALERSPAASACLWAWASALLGTAFMAGATFAVVADPPVVWLCILLAVPGFLGWIAPYFIHRAVKDKKTRRARPFIEAKMEEIYEICEKGHSLL